MVYFSGLKYALSITSKLFSFMQCLHTGFIGIWQPEAGLNKHIHIHKCNVLVL